LVSDEDHGSVVYSRERHDHGWSTLYIFLGISSIAISLIFFISRFHNLHGFDRFGGSFDIPASIVLIISGYLLLKGGYTIRKDPGSGQSFSILGSIIILVTDIVLFILWIGDLLDSMINGESISMEYILSFPLSYPFLLGIITLISMVIFSRSTGFFRSNGRIC